MNSVRLSLNELCDGLFMPLCTLLRILYIILYCVHPLVILLDFPSPRVCVYCSVHVCIDSNAVPVEYSCREYR